MGNYPIYVKSEYFPTEYKYFNFNDEINEDKKKYFVDVIERSVFENFMNEYVYRDQSNKLYIKKSNTINLKMELNISKLLNYKYDYDVVSYIVNKNKDRGYGIFANDFIKKDSIICRCDKQMKYIYGLKGVSELINDLNYYPFMNEYEYHRMDMIEQNINVSTICINGILYLKAIKDINRGEELSKLYGIDFWFNKYPYNDKEVMSLLEKFITKHRIVKMMKEKTYKIASYVDNKDLFGDFGDGKMSKLTFFNKEEYLKCVPFNMNDGNYFFYVNNYRILYVSICNNTLIEYIGIDNHKDDIDNRKDDISISSRYYYENNEWFVDSYCLNSIHKSTKDTKDFCEIIKEKFFIDDQDFDCNMNKSHQINQNNE